MDSLPYQQFLHWVIRWTEFFGRAGFPNNNEKWINNEAHGGLFGVYMNKDGLPGCSHIQGFFIWKSFDHGIYFQVLKSYIHMPRISMLWLSLTAVSHNWHHQICNMILNVFTRKDCKSLLLCFICSSQTIMSIVVSNVILVDNGLGIMPLIYAPPSLSHAYADKTVHIYVRIIYIKKTSFCT